MNSYDILETGTSIVVGEKFVDAEVGGVQKSIDIQENNNNVRSGEKPEKKAKQKKESTPSAAYWQLFRFILRYAEGPPFPLCTFYNGQCDWNDA